MDHAITWASLFGVGLTLCGVLLCGLAIMVAFAGGMSDDIQASKQTGSMALRVGLGGVASLALGIWLLS